MAEIPRDSSLRKTWSPEEDSILIDYITTHGEGHWTSLPQKTGLKRRGKSCRLRWLNYLHPSIKRGNFSGDEEELIIRLHRLLGNRWSLIAKRLPGRTDNDVKNYWNTHLCKQSRHKNNPLQMKSKDCHWNSTVAHKVEKTNVVGHGDCEPCANRIITETPGNLLDKSFDFCEKQEEEKFWQYTVPQNLQSDEPVSICSLHDLLPLEINSDMNNLLYPVSFSALLSPDLNNFWGSL